MADNITLNTGSGGDTLAADDISGVKFQRAKIVFGADGSATDASFTDPFPIYTGQDKDANNTMTITSADASPGTPWVGTWTETLTKGFVRQLVTVASATTSGLGGTFTFEYGPDGVSATISETRVITDFATVRDFDLLNADNYFRVKFEPDVALGANTVFVTTINRRSFDGFFVRLGNQELELANAAMAQTFAYLKVFKPDNKSANVPANSAGALLFENFSMAVGRGEATGFVAAHIAGRNTDIDISSTPEDIWGGGDLYAGHPTGSPETVDVFSDSADDTSAGTGAQTLRIYGLKTSTSTAEETEDITLDGVSTVVSSNTWYRIYKAAVLTAGSGETNAGIITIQHTTTSANVFAKIPVGQGHSSIGAFTIPDATTGFINSLYFVATRGSGAAGSAVVALQERQFGTGAWVNKRTYDISTGSPLDVPLQFPIIIPSQADIRFRIVSVSDNDTILTVECNIVVKDD